MGIRNSDQQLARIACESHYPPVSDTLRQWGAYITGVGSEAIAPYEQYPREHEHPSMYGFRWTAGRVLPEYAVVLIVSGRGEFESESAGIIPIHAPCVFFLFPGEWHRYRPLPETGWHEYWLTLHGEQVIRLADLLELNAASPVRPSLQHSIKPLQRTISRLCSHFLRSPSANTLQESMIAMQLLSMAAERAAHVTGAAAAESSRTTNAIASAAIDVIWSRSHHRLSVQSLANLLKLGRRRLERAIRKSCSRTVHEEILRCRIERASRLLEETSLPIKHITYLAGFESPERLRISMINATGLSPSQYREHKRRPRALLRR